MMEEFPAARKKIAIDFLERKPEITYNTTISNTNTDFLLIAVLIVEFKISEISRYYLDLFGSKLTYGQIVELKVRSFKIGKRSKADPDRDDNDETDVWVLSDRQRTQVLKDSNLVDALPHFLPVLQNRNDNELENLFHLFLLGSAPALSLQNINQLTATFTICKWLRGTGFSLPNEEELNLRLKQEEFLQPFRHLTHNFKGRKKEIDFLASYLNWIPNNSISKRTLNTIRQSFMRDSMTSPLLITGIGGAGKSTLVSKVILDHLVFDKERRQLPFLYFDFDRPGLTISEPLLLLARAFSQLRLQFPDQESYFQYPAESITAELELSESKGVAPDREGLSRKFADLFKQSSYNDQPVLVVLDSFEELQHRVSNSDLRAFFNFLNFAATIIPRLRVIIVGRSDLNLYGLPVERLFLEAFDQESAIAYLTSRNIDVTVALQLFTRFGGNPLSLQLAAQLLQEVGSQSEMISMFNGIDAELIQKELITRNLYHIHDEKVRQLAIPGSLMRRITPEVIKEVLAVPCGIGVISLSEAESIYSDLLQDTFLIHLFDDGASFRQDVRESLEPFIIKGGQYEFKAIHDRAVAFYDNRDKTADRAEYLYHRLKRGDDAMIILDECKPAMRPFLEPSFKEFPDEARVVFAAMFRINVDERPLTTVSKRVWEYYLLHELPDMLSHGDEDLLASFAGLINKRGETLSENRKVNDLVSYLFERLGYGAKALEILETQEKREDARYALNYSRLLEHSGDYRHAYEYLKKWADKHGVNVFKIHDNERSDYRVHMEIALIILRTSGRSRIYDTRFASQVMKFVRDLARNRREDQFRSYLPRVYRQAMPTADLIQLFIKSLEIPFDSDEKFNANNQLLNQQIIDKAGLENFLTRYQVRLKDVCPPGTLEVNIADIALFTEMTERIFTRAKKYSVPNNKPQSKKSIQFKRLVICCDGLWHRAASTKGEVLLASNVEKIFHAIADADEFGRKQLKLYERGIARDSTFVAKFLRHVNLEDIEQSVKNIYSYIVLNYQPGDELFFFGFSKGAYFARTVVGLIRTCGILKTNDLKLIDRATAMYFDKTRPEAGPENEVAVKFRKAHSYPHPEIRFLGVWETVGILGIPTSPFQIVNKRKYQFNDNSLSKIVRHGCQALAIDERRLAFRPSIWNRPPVNQLQRIEQCWFAGTHANIGGGYPDSSLSDIALNWMAEKAAADGLQFQDDFFNNLRPSSTGKIYNPLTYSDYFVALINRKIHLDGPVKEIIHPAVLERIHLDISYRPPNIAKILPRITAPDILENERKPATI